MAESWQQPSGESEEGAAEAGAAPREPEVRPEPATRAFERPRPRGRSRTSAAVKQVSDVEFPVALRGYDRAAVDQHLSTIAQLVAELEATQLRENVVQRALDEVGEQTSRILQQAHESADEITAQSRAQAEGRIQRAEREAEITRRETDAYAEQIAEDTRLLWEERTRLIEEMRQFAEDVLAVADDAHERLPRPGADASADDEPPSGVVEAEPVDAADPDATVEVDAVEPDSGRS